MSMKKLIPIISALAGMIMLAGCATDGSVTVSSGYYYEPYPVYVGPPVVIYQRPYVVRHYYVRPCPPPVHHAPPVRPQSPTHRLPPRPGSHER